MLGVVLRGVRRAMLGATGTLSHDTKRRRIRKAKGERRGGRRPRSKVGLLSIALPHLSSASREIGRRHLSALRCPKNRSGFAVPPFFRPLRKLRPRFFCHRQREAAIPPLGEGPARGPLICADDPSCARRARCPHRAADSLRHGACGGRAATHPRPSEREARHANVPSCVVGALHEAPAVSPQRPSPAVGEGLAPPADTYRRVYTSAWPEERDRVSLQKR